MSFIFVSAYPTKFMFTNLAGHMCASSILVNGNPAIWASTSVNKIMNHATQFSPQMQFTFPYLRSQVLNIRALPVLFALFTNQISTTFPTRNQSTILASLLRAWSNVILISQVSLQQKLVYRSTIYSVSTQFLNWEFLATISRAWHTIQLLVYLALQSLFLESIPTYT